jgi:transcription elongation factor GreA
MPTIPITRRGADKLKAELHRLKTVDRPAVIGAIAEARAQGDLSENAEYDAAKDRQGFIEGRIQEVESKLSMAQVIDPSTLEAGGRVVFGATVELEDEASGERRQATRSSARTRPTSSSAWSTSAARSRVP